MKTMIAIGGGSFQKGETKAIDVYAIQRTKKMYPNVLFFPTASKDDQGYAKRFKQYMRSLNCEIEVIRLFHTKLNKQQVQEKIRNCDILYLGAGNLKRLMDVFTTWDLIKTIKEAYEHGVVCIGNSAGASAFFNYGYSDLYDDGTCYDYIKGMDMIVGCFCPHAQDERRKDFFKQPDMNGIRAIGCEDGNAYIVEDDTAYDFKKSG